MELERGSKQKTYSDELSTTDGRSVVIFSEKVFLLLRNDTSLAILAVNTIAIRLTLVPSEREAAGQKFCPCSAGDFCPSSLFTSGKVRKRESQFPPLSSYGLQRLCTTAVFIYAVFRMKQLIQQGEQDQRCRKVPINRGLNYV